MTYWYWYPPYPDYNYKTCPQCGGNGINNGVTCWQCGGTGAIFKPPVQPWPRPNPTTPKWVPQCTCGRSNTTVVCPVHPNLRF